MCLNIRLGRHLSVYREVASAFQFLKLLNIYYMTNLRITWVLKNLLM